MTLCSWPPGAHKSKPMGVEGEEEGYKGFLAGGIEFLREAYMGKPTGMGKKVCVVGGGNTAIDCVRVGPARRSGGIDPALPADPQRNAGRFLGN